MTYYRWEVFKDEHGNALAVKLMFFMGFKSTVYIEDTIPMQNKAEAQVLCDNLNDMD